MQPETKYAASGDVNIAYQVVSNGPHDLVLVPGWASNIEVFWEEPTFVHFLERLATFSRLILFDKRGTGLSDRVPDMPTLETRMDDVRAVMDTVGSERAALLGYSEGATMCALFAATFPARTSALIMVGGYATRVRTPDYPWAPTAEQGSQFIEAIRQEWGGPVGIEDRAPSMATDARFRSWWARMLRMSASPSAIVALLKMNFEVDIRHVLPSIRVPTLILHNSGDRLLDVQGSRYMAERIPGAKYVELDGVDHVPFVGNSDAILDEIEEFLTGVRPDPDPERVLATVLFTDIVGSTEHLVALGDRQWKDVLERHHTLVRTELARFRGREIDTAGDGFLATFDGPARAIRCACAISKSVRHLGIDIRAGLHTGECEVIGEKVGGIAVHIGARVAGLAAAGEVLVSSTVKDLVAGSGIAFQSRGTHTLRGIPGEWHLFTVREPTA
jgi:pimeloyl-ACP methyl ester carboxylesterase/class 3 adenylate cyclase